MDITLCSTLIMKTFEVIQRVRERAEHRAKFSDFSPVLKHHFRNLEGFLFFLFFLVGRVIFVLL